MNANGQWVSFYLSQDLEAFSDSLFLQNVLYFGLVLTSSTIDKKTLNYKKLEIELEIDKNLEIELEIYKNLENKLEIYSFFKLENKLEIFEFFCQW